MELVLTLFLIQGVIGALDNLWHHEITEDLTHRPTARGELALHTVREFLYAIIFLGLGWMVWHGAWAWALACLIGIEIGITLWDFIVEDQTRRLPKFERVLHTILAINLGVILASLAPLFLDWMGKPTDLIGVSYGWRSWAMTLMGVGVFLWALYDLYAVVRLGVPDWHRRPIKAGKRPNPRQVLITGGTGFIGRHITRSLIETGDRPIILARDKAKAVYLFGPHIDVIDTLDAIKNQDRIDAVINLAGAPLLGGLWTKARRKTLVESRRKTTSDLITLIGRLSTPPEVLISGSAIGYYGTNQSHIFTERDPANTNFTAQLCAHWEGMARQAEARDVRVCLLRMGIVFGSDAGAFPQLTRPIALGLGTVFGSGRQWMSWIHIDDLVRMIVWTLDDKALHGPINAVAPNPVTAADFTQSVANHLKRPVWFKIPERLLTGLMGEMSEFFIKGQEVEPRMATELGFNFMHPSLEHAILDLLPQQNSDQAQAAQTCGIYYNDACPICDGEIAHYRKLTNAGDLTLSFHEISNEAQDLAPYRLSTDDLKKRLYVIDQNGRLKGGAEAFVLIWQQIPKYRWAARLLAWKPVFWVADLVYDGLIAPCLFAWNLRRDARLARRVDHG